MIDRLTAGFPGSGKGNPGSAKEQGCVSLSLERTAMTAEVRGAVTGGSRR